MAEDFLFIPVKETKVTGGESRCQKSFRKGRPDPRVFPDSQEAGAP